MQLFRKLGDYEAFERAIEKTLETCPLPKSQAGSLCYTRLLAERLAGC